MRLEITLCRELQQQSARFGDRRRLVFRMLLSLSLDASLSSLQIRLLFLLGGALAGRQSPGTVSSGPLLSLPPPSHLPLFTRPNQWILTPPFFFPKILKKNRFHISPNLHISPNSQILSK
jgi:hypothetical protein